MEHVYLEKKSVIKQPCVRSTQKRVSVGTPWRKVSKCHTSTEKLKVFETFELENKSVTTCEDVLVFLLYFLFLCE